MGRAGALVLAVALAACGRGAEAPERVRAFARKQFGRHYLGITGQRKVSERVAALCQGCSFYNVKVGYDRPAPNPIINELNYVIVGEKRAAAIRQPKDVAAFLSSLATPVPNELDAFRRALVFAELAGGTLRTALPRKSIIKQYQSQKQADWDLVVSGHKAGWDVALTVMVDKAIDYCIRYRLRIEKTGALAILERRVIYAYTLYE
ncbi:hypothetical protein ACFL09_02395 [Planctomycetota bacterium]